MHVTTGDLINDLQTRGMRLVDPRGGADSRDVVAIARSFADGGGYKWEGHGVPEDVVFKGHVILSKAKSPLGTYCYHADMKGTYGDIWLWQQGYRANVALFKKAARCAVN